MTHKLELPPMLTPSLRERLWEVGILTAEVCDGLVAAGVRTMDDAAKLKESKWKAAGVEKAKVRGRGGGG